MKLTCRKCGGAHLSINCNKDKSLEVDKDTEKKELFEEKINPDISINDNAHLTKIKKTYRIKILDLPNDITNMELMELLYEWGEITNIKINNYSNYAVVYIDFVNKHDADYFIKALDDTKFEYSTIKIFYA